MDNRPIGIFDSGVGGLTVVSEVMKLLPQEDIVYFGDTARVPYGAYSRETLIKFSGQVVRFLLTKDVKGIIIACGTVSSNCYADLAEEFEVPFIDFITPGVEACLQTTQSHVVGVIATEATIQSGAYERLLKDRCPNVTVYSTACPLFVPLAEEGWTSNKVADLTAEIYLQELIENEIDSLILGCTHYPLLQDCIQKAVGNIKIVNPAVITAKKMRALLISRHMCNESDRTSEQVNYTFYVSGSTAKFNKTCKLVLDRNYEEEQAAVDGY